MSGDHADECVFRSLNQETVVSTSLGSGLALLDLRTKEYFSLDPVGAFIWETLRRPQRQDELVAAVVGEYDVSPETCAAEVEAFIEALRDADLIEVVDTAAG